MLYTIKIIIVSFHYKKVQFCIIILLFYSHKINKKLDVTIRKRIIGSKVKDARGQCMEKEMQNQELK